MSAITKSCLLAYPHWTGNTIGFFRDAPINTIMVFMLKGDYKKHMRSMGTLAARHGCAIRQTLHCSADPGDEDPNLILRFVVVRKVG